MLFDCNKAYTQDICYLDLANPKYTVNTPSIETHLAVVRGLPTKKFLPDCVNEKSSTERRS